MGVQTQTRFDTQLNGAITSIQTTATLDAAPAQTVGYGTIERGAASEEDIYWAGLAGLQLTGMLRGLSRTALTNTEVVGNQYAHVDNSVFEGTLLHYIVNNKTDVDEAEAITAAWTFNTALPTSTITPTVAGQLTRRGYVDDEIALQMPRDGSRAATAAMNMGSFRIQSLADPTGAQHAATRSYVDTQIAAQIDDQVDASLTDTTPGSLDQKITFNTHLSRTIITPAGDEDFRINTDAIQSTAGVANANAIIATDADGRLDSSFEAFSYTTGEAINGSVTPRALVQAGANYKDEFTVHSDGTNNDWNLAGDTAGGTLLSFGNADASTRRAQSFVYTNADANSITIARLVMFMVQSGAPADTVLCDIFSNTGGNLPDAVIANGTSNAVAAASVPAGGTIGTIEFEWAVPPTITSGTRFWLVFRRSGANDAGNFYQIGSEAADNYGDGTTSSFTASTVTWAAAGANDYYFHLEFNLNYGGEVFMLDVNDLAKGCNFVGFTRDNVGAGVAINVTPPGRLVAGFAGLTAGDLLYGSTTEGDTSETVPSADSAVTMIVGSARSATQVFIKDGIKTYYREINNFDLRGGASGANITADFFIKTGFRPHKVWLKYHVNDSTGAANDEIVTEQTFVGTGSAGGMDIRGLSAAGLTLTAATVVEITNRSVDFTEDEMFVSQIYDNGFELRVTQDTDPANFSNIFIIAEGY